MEALAPRRRVIALDHRGHGRSSQPGRGYPLHRLAADVHEVLTALDVDEITLLGHSMGVAVIWAYVDVFGDRGIDRLVFADSRPVLVRDRDWDDDEARLAGGMQTAAQLDDLTHRLRSPQGWDVLVEVLQAMVSADLAPERFEELLATNRPTTNETRAALWYDPVHLRLAGSHPHDHAPDTRGARAGKHDPDRVPALDRRRRPGCTACDHRRRRRGIAFRILGEPGALRPDRRRLPRSDRCTGWRRMTAEGSLSTSAPRLDLPSVKTMAVRSP